MLLFSANQLPKVHYQELPWQLFLRRCAVFYQGCWGATVTYEVGTFVATVFFLFSCVDFSSDMLVVVTSQNHGLRLQPPTAARARRIAPGSLLSLMAPTRFLWRSSMCGLFAVAWKWHKKTVCLTYCHSFAPQLLLCVCLSILSVCHIHTTSQT